MNKILIDTNLLVYAHDTSEKEKPQKAAALLETLFTNGNAFLALQNLTEFFFVVTKKIQNKLEEKAAKEIVQDFLDLETIKKIHYQGNTIIKAMHLVEEKKTGDFWDALLAATMLEHDVSIIYTENTKDFEKIEGITAVNPL